MINIYISPIASTVTSYTAFEHGFYYILNYYKKRRIACSTMLRLLIPISTLCKPMTKHINKRTSLLMCLRWIFHVIWIRNIISGGKYKFNYKHTTNETKKQLRCINKDKMSILEESEKKRKIKISAIGNVPKVSQRITKHLSMLPFTLGSRINRKFIHILWYAKH